MSIFEFIKVNPSQIIGDTKSYYENQAGYILSPADVEMIVLLTMAYREQNVLAKMEGLVHQNFVQLASGVSLDYRGEELGVIRINGEDDDSYRQRILGQNQFAPIGTRAAYISKAKSVPACADCRLQSKQENNLLAPGQIIVTLIEKVPVGSSTTGSVAGLSLRLAVLYALSDTQTNIVGDQFQIASALPIAVNGNVVIKRILGSNATTVQSSVEDVIDAYFNEISQSFSSQFDENELYRRMQAATDVFAIVTNSWGSVPVLQWREFYVKGTVNVSVI